MTPTTTRTRTTTALAASAAALALIPAGGASAAVVKGLQDQEMTVNNPTLTGAFLSAAQEAKVGFVRFNTRWDGKSTVVDPGQVAAIKAFAQQAPSRGVTAIEIAPNVSGDESFNPRRKKGPTAASKIDVSAYRVYIRSLADQLKAIPVARYYAPLNEPNWYRHIPKRGAGTVYRKLHNTAYEQIKAVDPKAKVLFGELLPYERAKSKSYPYGQSSDAGTFVREVLGLKSNWKAKGGTKTSSYRVKADGVALHTYDFKADPRKKRKDRDDWTQANLGYAKSDLRKAARTKRLPSAAASRIYLTEFAYKTAGSDKISTSRASTYLKRAWSIAKKYKVRTFLWYQLRDPSSSDEIWQSGLQTRDGGSRKTWTTFRGLR